MAEAAKPAAVAPIPAAVVEPVPAASVPEPAKTADQIAAEKVVADKAVADKVVADKVVADKAAADKVVADAAAAKLASEPKTGAPEKYTLTPPPEAALFIDATDIAKLEALAREAGMTNEEAQTVLGKQAAAMVAQSAAFRTETEAHETYGGEHLVETQRLATSVIERFAPKGNPLGDQLRADLVKTGFGNKLAVVSFLARIGKAMAEDRPGMGGGGGGESRDAATVLYGGTTIK